MEKCRLTAKLGFLQSFAYGAKHFVLRLRALATPHSRLSQRAGGGEFSPSDTRVTTGQGPGPEGGRLIAARVRRSRRLVRYGKPEFYLASQLLRHLAAGCVGTGVRVSEVGAT